MVTNARKCRRSTFYAPGASIICRTTHWTHRSSPPRLRHEAAITARPETHARRPYENRIGSVGAYLRRRPAPTRLLGAREARQGRVPDVLRFHCAGPVRARRRDAALVLVHGSAQGLRHGHPAGSELRDRLLGAGRQLPRELAGRGAVAERHRDRVGRARQGARATGSTGSAPTTAIPTRCR